MSKTAELARDAYLSANKKVRAIILADAEKRVQAMIGRVDALNQRLSAMCALLFAGAAVATTFTTNVGKVPFLAISFSVWAAICFGLAGALACTGLISRKSVFPGEAPSWWAAGAKLDHLGAQGWLVHGYEVAIESLKPAVARRAFFFNWTLALGFLGAVCIAAAAITVGYAGPAHGSRPGEPRAECIK